MIKRCELRIRVSRERQIDGLLYENVPTRDDDSLNLTQTYPNVIDLADLFIVKLSSPGDLAPQFLDLKHNTAPSLHEFTELRQEYLANW